MRARLLRFFSTILLLACAGGIAAQQLPPGTVLPVMLSSTLDARHARPSQTIVGKVMQDVPLPDGKVLRRGAKVAGHIISVRSAAPGTPAQVTLKFDRVEFKGQQLPIAAHLRALASMNEIYEARMPTNAWDDYGTSPSDWNTLQVGGAGVYRGSGELVDSGNQVIGRATDYGAVMAKLTPAPQRGCPASSEREQALWKFSPWACGTYGFGDLKIIRSHDADSAGVITLESIGNVHVESGSGWLLRVHSADEESK